jgi:hypothetical protein
MGNTIDGAIGDSPLSTIDVDAVIAAGRRRTRLRRLSALGSAGGTAVVLALGTVAAMNLVSPSSPSLPPPAQPAAPVDATAPVRADETPEQTRQRIVAALTNGLTGALPGVQLSDGPTGQPGVSLFVDEGRGVYSADIVLTTTAGEGEIFFESWPNGQVTPPAAAPTLEESAGEAVNRGEASTPADGVAEPPVAETGAWIESCTDLPDQEQPDCLEVVGPDGQKVVVVTARHSEGAQSEVPDGGPGAEPIDGSAAPEIAFHYAYVTWANARVLISIASDLKRGEPGPFPGVLLLTPEQLADIALDPDLTVTA